MRALGRLDAQAPPDLVERKREHCLVIHHRQRKRAPAAPPRAEQIPLPVEIRAQRSAQRAQFKPFWERLAVKPPNRKPAIPGDDTPKV